ncbi:MAG TPA: NAD(P)-binding protein [Candidatus Saccharimonadales bacterium]|nr:NAD(P)-binding protein [Candidatus Saccharimonadales bacterium]
MAEKVIIVGGGIAGMSCALALQKAKRDFLLITENLGGRIFYSDSTKVNFGAYFVMQNYHHAQELVTRESRINALDCLFVDEDLRSFSPLSLRLLGLLPELLRLVKELRAFGVHYERYKDNCLTRSQREALEADPYMAELFQRSASSFISEKKIERVVAATGCKFVYACTGVGVDRINALDFLNVCMGMLIPIYKFHFDALAISDQFAGSLEIDSVSGLDNTNEQIVLRTRSGKKHGADFLVLATPAAVTQQLLCIPEIRHSCKLYTHHVKAKLRDKYAKYKTICFTPGSEVVAIARQDNGTYLIYTTEKNTDLNQVCESYSALKVVPWERAMYVDGSAYLEQQYDSNIFVAGDHNGLGLEPAAISGIYAANQVLKATLRNAHPLPDAAGARR